MARAAGREARLRSLTGTAPHDCKKMPRMGRGKARPAAPVATEVSDEVGRVLADGTVENGFSAALQQQQLVKGLLG